MKDFNYLGYFPQTARRLLGYESLNETLYFPPHPKASNGVRSSDQRSLSRRNGNCHFSNLRNHLQEEAEWLSGQRDDQLAQAAISMPDIPFEIRPTCAVFCFQSEDLSINSNNQSNFYLDLNSLLCVPPDRATSFKTGKFHIGPVLSILSAWIC